VVTLLRKENLGMRKVIEMSYLASSGEDNHVLKRRKTNINQHSEKNNPYMQEAIFFLKV